jgi:hypothetical protein
VPESYKILSHGSSSVAGGGKTIYTVPANTQAIIKFISIIQGLAAGSALNALIAQIEGNDAADARPVTGRVVLAPGEWCEWEGTLSLPAAGFLMLYLEAGSAPVQYTVSGVEITP